jgi:gluconolactonase
MNDFQTIATGLLFPEGPIALPNGDVLVVEILAGQLTRIAPDGNKTVVAKTGGGPNGAAIGPDGKCYVCNNGGFAAVKYGDLLLPGPAHPDTPPGSIQRIDLSSGAVETLYSHAKQTPFWGPNDLVFDDAGGFWFTDFGRSVDRIQHIGSLYYAKADGSFIEEVVHPLHSPNGVGLSPDGKAVYVAETFTSQVTRFELEAPGKIRRLQTMSGGTVIGRGGVNQFLDSMAVDAVGNVCVAAPGSGGIIVFAADGSSPRHIPLPDFLTTNICFGGPDLCTAFITLSSSGRLISMPWPNAGARLNYLNSD